MKQLFLEKGQVFVREVPQPAVQADAVLVRVHYSFISSGTESATLAASGTSLGSKFVRDVGGGVQKLSATLQEHGASGTMVLLQNKMHTILPLGYSCSGQVVAVGAAVQSVMVGDYVACAGAGIAQHAEVIAVPKNLLVKLRDKNALKKTSITAIGAIAMQGLRRSGVSFGDTVCVLGLGLIGQLTVQLAKHAGCTVIGVDIDEGRLATAQVVGCDVVLNNVTDDAAKRIAYYTQHRGVDATLITASASSGDLIDQSMHFTRRRGKVVLVGDVPLQFSREQFYAKEIDFLISCSYGPGRYDAAYEQRGVDYPYAYVRWTEQRNMELFVRLVEDGAIDLTPIISHEYTFDHAREAYQVLQNKKSLGIVLAYPSDTQPVLPAEPACELQYSALIYMPPKGDLLVGVVGAGGFAKLKLLPILAQQKRTHVHAIVDSNPAAALSVARQYNATVPKGGVEALCERDDIHAVVISSPHQFHAAQTIACLQAGKAVFVEKPAAVTEEEFAAIEAVVRTGNSLYCVDFNRSFSPFMQAVKHAVAQRSVPLSIYYRMNAGFIPADHWIQSPENRGRVIGEACHIFELFCFLSDAAPHDIFVAPLLDAREDMQRTDNLTITIRFIDGSVCTLLYSAVGNKNLRKEYMELFWDGKSVVMDDYSNLIGHGLPISFNKKDVSPDKGHAALLAAFVQAAQTPGANAPVPFERIAHATRLSFIVDRLARAGGGYERYCGEDTHV